MIRREWAMDPDNKVTTVGSSEYRCLDRTDAREINPHIPAELHVFIASTGEIGVEPVCCTLHPLLIQNRLLAPNQIPKQACTEMPIKQGVLEPVLETAQTPVTGPIALPRTSLKELNGVLEHGSTVLFNTSSETGASSQCVIDVNLRFEALMAAGREGRPKFRLKFPSFDLQPLCTRDGDCFCQSAKRNFRSPKSGAERQWLLHAERDE